MGASPSQDSGGGASSPNENKSFLREGNIMYRKGPKNFLSAIAEQKYKKQGYVIKDISEREATQKAAAPKADVAPVAVSAAPTAKEIKPAKEEVNEITTFDNLKIKRSKDLSSVGLGA